MRIKYLLLLGSLLSSSYFSFLWSKPIAERQITYQNKNYIVPKGQLWKLTWKTPYKGGEIHPAYDVRVLGQLYDKKSIGHIQKISFRGKDAYNVLALKASAEIWIGPETEFYLANDRIKVDVLTYKVKNNNQN